MARRTMLLGVIAALAFTSMGATADDQLPIPEAAAVAEVIPAGACTPESEFDAPDRYSVDANGQLTTDKWGELVEGASDRGTTVCERLKVVFGPIMVKPGQNDVLIQPVTFEKPLYDGQLVRFKPSLIAADGTPPVEDLHLHHGTWLNAGRSYGWGPWIASGEEKTIVTWPHRYGLEVKGSDTWLFLHMIHSAIATPRPVWVTYDMDFVPSTAANVLQADGKPLVTTTKGVWLDVGGGSFHPETEVYPYNPVFNIHRGFGDAVDNARGAHTLDLYSDAYSDAGLTATECYYPQQNCALYNSLNNESAQQGNDVSDDALPSNYDAPFVLGKDWKFPSQIGSTNKGTLVLMGGHLHNGGLRDEVELVRDLNGDKKYAEDEEALIHISDAYYWDHVNRDRVGGPPVSWDFSQNGVTNDLGWAINVQGGDILRLNGVYDTALGSWYEQMGIVMAWVVPDQQFGVDMFVENGTMPNPEAGKPDIQLWKHNPAVTIDLGIAHEAKTPKGPDGNTIPATCVPSQTNVCVRGQITHPHYSASGNHARINRGTPIPDNIAIDGPMLEDEIFIGGFTFGPFDFGVTAASGIPRLRVGESVTITNLDTGAYLWHTLTRCAAPCTGTTSASFPYADGAYQDLLDGSWGSGDRAGDSLQDLFTELGPDPMDFDSAELGIGLAPSGKISWEFTPTRTGTFTFFCRIHPGMRGAFKVV